MALVLLLMMPTRSCHIVIKGMASVLRENVCYQKRECRQALNKIIHCPNFTKKCDVQMQNENVVTNQCSMNFMIRSGFYREILELRGMNKK
eukprot:746317-Hanusia_phi.AAC.4